MVGPEVAEKRIAGLEMEYGISMRDPEGKVVGAPGSSSITDYFYRSSMFPYVHNAQVARSASGMLLNGMRHYLDIGTHPETATPECASFDDVVVYDMAAEEMTAEHMAELVENGQLSQVMLNKRVSDHGGNTFGAHESYETDNRDLWKKAEGKAEFAAAAQAAHLVSRSVWAGAGCVDQHGTFHKTQKIRLVEDNTSTATTRKKPVVNTKDEPLGTRNRIHIIEGCPNISPWANWLKLASTSLVIRLLEYGVFPEGAMVADPVVAARALGSTASLDTVVRLQKGGKATGIEIQEVLHASAVELGEKVQLPDEEYEALAEWEAILADLKRSPDICADRIDWINKLVRIDGIDGSEGIDPTNRRKRRTTDIAYDLILFRDRSISKKEKGFHEQRDITQGGAGIALRDRGHFRRTPSKERVQHCRDHAPADTRAALRSYGMRRLIEVGKLKGANWDYITGTHGQSFYMGDSREYSTQRFDYWFAKHY